MLYIPSRIHTLRASSRSELVLDRVSYRLHARNIRVRPYCFVLATRFTAQVTSLKQDQNTHLQHLPHSPIHQGHTANKPTGINIGMQCTSAAPTISPRTRMPRIRTSARHLRAWPPSHTIAQSLVAGLEMLDRTCLLSSLSSNIDVTRPSYPPAVLGNVSLARRKSSRAVSMPSLNDAK